MLGKKLSEHISLKRVNCQVIGPLYLQAYSQILDMYWITSYVDTMLNPMEEVPVEHTQPPHDSRMQSSLMS
tara:strand:+ start:62 stop:274 length:213 start_codon:yes stop_codon:yes gene_type:complete